jgi:hypothetical protein
MRLAELIPHTSQWTGIPETHVNSVARTLRPAGLLSTAGKGPKAAAMSVEDKLNLFLGTCAVEVANRAAEHVRVWNRLVGSGDANHKFAFARAKTVQNFFVDLITKDLNGGPLDVWLKEADDAYDRVPGLKAAPRHTITLDFYVDEFSFTIAVSRFISDFSHLDPTLRQSSGDTIEVTFVQPVPGGKHKYQPPRRDHGYSAGSRLIRRLNANNLRGWGTCLIES